jgi:hypothetical protein
MKKLSPQTAIINNEDVTVIVLQDLGYQAGFYMKEVEYKGVKYLIQSSTKKGPYTARTVIDRLLG